jgi:DnaJ like chaperone protein
LRFFYGKLIAGALGLLLGGPIGLLIGLFVGHAFDRGMVKTLAFGSPGNMQRIRETFFETTFTLLGYVAKADGRVSESEIQHTEALFAQMGLSAEQRQRAIGLFKRGTAPDFHPEPVVAAFVGITQGQRVLTQTLLLFLVTLALSDQKLEPSERAALQRVAAALNITVGELDQLLQMAQAQMHFHGAGAGDTAAPAGSTLEDAYMALGIDKGASDAEVKKAYRRRMSENHPDKLIAKGVPEDMIKLATERSQEIQAAYDMIRRARGMGRAA